MTDKTKDFLNRLNAVGEKIKKTIENTKEMKEKALILKNDVIEFTNEVKVKKG